jgi:hypothetical protein
LFRVQKKEFGYLSNDHRMGETKLPGRSISIMRHGARRAYDYGAGGRGKPP